MVLQAAQDSLAGALGKLQLDGFLPQYYPVTNSSSSTEVEDGDDSTVRTLSNHRLMLFFACSVLSFLLSAGSAVGLAWGYSVTPHSLEYCPGPSEPAHDKVVRRALSAEDQDEEESCFDTMIRLHGKDHTFEDITGVKGHVRPPMYGKVREMTIWSYWYDPAHCPNSENCKIPDAIQLCRESIEKNKGSFDFHLVHMDTARNFVSMMELPLRWHRLQPVRQKEALMNALLARYGGVALDLSVVLLRPLDDLWRELLIRKATFMGYMYRINGESWHQPEETAQFFLMSRREGIFSTAVRNQVVRHCDAYRFPDLGLGDHTLTPVLGSINSSLPTCWSDDSVQHREACPQPVQPRPNDTLPDLDPPRMDRHILLTDPRDGPHLPFSHLDHFGMGAWQTTNTSRMASPPPLCNSPSECWQKVVLPRYNSGSLVLIKLFHRGGALATRSRKELLADETTFFHGWLKLAGLGSLGSKSVAEETGTKITRSLRDNVSRQSGGRSTGRSLQEKQAARHASEKVAFV